MQQGTLRVFAVQPAFAAAQPGSSAPCAHAGSLRAFPVSSHTARPPASCSGEGATPVADSLLSSPKREIKVSLDGIWGATPVAVRAAVGAPAGGGVPFALDGRG